MNIEGQDHVSDRISKLLGLIQSRLVQALGKNMAGACNVS